MTAKASSRPPFADHSITEYERCLLGAYVMGADIGVQISKDAFSSGAHKVIFQAIKNLKALGVEVDLVTLVSELEKRGQLDAAGGAASIAKLTDGVISTANTAFFENEVLTAFRGRGIWKAAALAKEALKNREAPDTVSATLVASIENIVASGAQGGRITACSSGICL
jgi:replicative DNA helicase